jgi:hypothetical protein
MKNSPLLTVALGLSVLLFASNPAYAYLDPGTGSMIVQAIIGMVVAVSVSLSIFRNRIKAFLKRLFKPGSDQNNNPSPNGN